MPRQPVPETVSPYRTVRPSENPQKHCGRDPAIPVAWGGSGRVTGRSAGPMTWLDEVT